MQKAKAFVIASEGLTTNLLVERLSTHLEVTTVFIEPHESYKTILRRRIKRLGFIKTVHQVLFLVFVLPFIGKRKKRIAAILAHHKLSGKPLNSSIKQMVPSVHEASIAKWIISENPAVVFINGTRILKKSLLDQIDCPIVNIHGGITTIYRGVHGGYWAVHYNDLKHFGVTLHLVDAGIDTGAVIAQRVITPTAEDNFKTYPILQYCHGLDLISENLESLLGGEINTIPPVTKESKLHYHPTLWEFISGKI
jgi:folate-dependent phosphoribosylglycinamide formyltransferase PurN